jgi:tetratricopeptide (TPR) repeat protein
LEEATLWRLSASRQQAELLEMLFPDGLDELPRLSQASEQANTLNALAAAYHLSGQPGRAVPLFRRATVMLEEQGDQGSVSVGLSNLANALLLSGQLRAAEAAARRALHITREREDRFQEAVSLCWLGLALAARGMDTDSGKALNRSLQLASKTASYEAYDYQAMRALWFAHYDDA